MGGKLTKVFTLINRDGRKIDRSIYFHKQNNVNFDTGYLTIKQRYYISCADEHCLVASSFIFFTRAKQKGLRV